MKDFFSDRFEKFYENLNSRERCVFKEALLEHQRNDKVIELCWDDPVESPRVSQTILDIEKKYLKFVMGYTDAEIEMHFEKQKNKKTEKGNDNENQKE